VRPFDVERLTDGNTLIVDARPRKERVVEVDPEGKVVWEYIDPNIPFDADRLPNGNTLVVWAWGNDSADPEVRELDPKCNVVWAWHADRHLAGEKRILDQEGFTHTNSAIRLSNGNTLISLRNFYMLVEVNRAGNIVWKLPGLFTTPHDPEILANGNILVNTRGPQVLREITPGGRTVWAYRPNQREVQTVRYNHRLPNGNILFVERTKIIEITPQKEVVWQLRLPNLPVHGDYRNRWLYKAERIPTGHRPAPAHAFVAPSETLRRTGEVPLTFEQHLQANVAQRVRAWFRFFDRNHDARIARAEFRGRGSFGDIDTDGDGFLSRAEVKAFHTDHLMHMHAGARTGNTGSAGGSRRRGRE
jgi:hypothetical protein